MEKSQKVGPPPVRDELHAAKRQKIHQICARCGYQTTQAKRYSDHQRSCMPDGGESSTDADAMDITLVGPPIRTVTDVDEIEEWRRKCDEKTRQAEETQRFMYTIAHRTDMSPDERQKHCLYLLDQFSRHMNEYCGYRAKYFSAYFSLYQ